MTDATPRISAPHLERFANRTVRLLGKVTQLRGQDATLDADGSVQLILNRDTHLQLGRAVEVVGKVTNELGVKVLACTDFGTDIDFKAVNAVVDATHRYREIFYGDGER